MGSQFVVKKGDLLTCFNWNWESSWVGRCLLIRDQEPIQEILGGWQKNLAINPDQVDVTRKDRLRGFFQGKKTWEFNANYECGVRKDPWQIECKKIGTR